MSNLVTIKQAMALRDIGYKEPTTKYTHYSGTDKNYKSQKTTKYLLTWNKIRLILPMPTVDEVIDWFRRKHHIMIYNCIEPFVDPTNNRITYGYRVKKCNVKWGWNHREYISNKVFSTDCNAAKRTTIWSAIRYIKKQKENATRRRNRRNRRKTV